MLDAGRGSLALLTAVVCYGSYFVPAKRYEIHDGLVYQWYQCNGIMLTGVAVALSRNDWSSTSPSSTGFYVCYEGVLSGLLVQFANILANRSVKAVGLGNYYTVHQVTNLGGAFFVGIFGPRFGVPTTPPTNVVVAFFGLLFVLIGVVPVMFMEKESDPPHLTHATQVAYPSCLPRQSERVDATTMSRSTGPFDHNLSLAPAVPRSTGGALANDGAGRQSFKVHPIEQQRRVDANHDLSSTSASFWDSTGRQPHFARGVCNNVPDVVTERFEFPRRTESTEAHLQDPLVPDVVAPQELRETTDWCLGMVLSLVAGLFYAATYVPLVMWKARMQRAGYHAQGFETFFSMSVGLYSASTLWMLAGSAWMRHWGKKMQKSVLRPALASGVIYSGATLSYLYAMMVVPYAVAYALGVGGGLAVSLLWGMLVFGEAASRRNRICVAISFSCVFVGIVLLGFAA